MKSLSAALISALLVFTLATVWSEVVQPQMELIARANAAKATGTATKSNSRKVTRQIAQAELDADEMDAEDEAAMEPVAKVAAKPARLTKKQREEAAADDKAKERVVAQLAEVKQQESRLAAREETLRMLYDDIRSELANMEDLRRRSVSELAASERRGLEGAKPNSGSSGESGNEAPRQRVTAEARIASVIQDLARQGNVAAAASLLSGMKDREVAKVLTSLSASDPRLALRLSDQVQTAKQEPLRR